MAFNLFPYSNFHKLNLDWVIKTIREAKEALDQAAQTVIGYESRLAAVESSVSTLSSSVNLLRVTVNGHTLRLDQAQSDIANHTQQINSLDSRLGLQNTTIHAQGLRIDQAQSDIANHTQQITQLGEDVQEALEKAEHPIITDENGTSTVTPKLSTDELNRRVLLLEGNSELLPHVFSPILRNIANPVLEGDAANKSYVDNLADITTATKTTPTTDTLSPVWESGYCEPTTGIVRESSSYLHNVAINVSEGDLIYVRRQSDSAVIPDARFLTAYLNNTVQADKGGNNVTFPYTVPAGVDTLVFSILASYGSGSTITRVHMNTETVDKMQVPVENLYQIVQSGKKNSFEYAFNVAAGNYCITNKSLEDECGYRICFTAKLSALTGEIKINKGTTSNYGGAIGIDSTNIYVYLGTSTTPLRTQAHGLTIADYIAVTLDASYTTKATITVSTNGGSYSWVDTYWSSKIGIIKVESSTDTLSDCNLSYACEGVLKDTWVFGDSYLLNGDNTRWAYYLVQKGYKNFLLNGYGGRQSIAALNSLKIDLELNRVPKRIIWTLGMNDKDGDSVPNTNWVNSINELISICEAYNIELILSTVPNVPATTTKNTLKNEWVRNSGYRYIDFANAVSPNGDSTWYAGMLSSDNVHPTQQGAIALYHCAVTAVPELLL